MKYDFDELRKKVKNKEYKLIGSGSSRLVYDLNNGYVLKVAKDIRGLNQNEAENKIYQSCKSTFFAEIIEVSENNVFLVMPKAKKIKNINTVLKYYKKRNIQALLLDTLLDEDIGANSIGKGDLKRASNWGIIDGVPLIIDYGLTKSIFKKYYRFNLIIKKRFKPIVLSS